MSNRPNSASRRRFLQGMTATAALGLSTSGLATEDTGGTSLVILHTNDTHSYIDPIPESRSRNGGDGGAARRASLIKEIRRQHKHVLLLDSGDMFQGTPYFNMFGGEIEFKVMSAMGYDVTTIGNHEFDNGISGLVKQMPHAKFEFVSANYEVTQSPLAEHVKPYTTRQFGDIKVGIFGLGIELDGLVLPRLCEGVSYIDPIPVAREMVQQLRNDGCHFIVCLSHLGYRYRSDRVDDMKLAAEVQGIDLILGGHSHTFLDEPELVGDPGQSTMVHQVGCFGVRLGRINVDFSSQQVAVRKVAGHYRVGRDRVMV